MKFEVLTTLVSEIESKHAVSLRGDLHLLGQLEKIGQPILLSFLDSWCKAFLQSAECRNRRPLRGLALEGVSSRINGGVKNFLAPLLEKIYDVDGKEHSDPCPVAFSDCYQVGSLLTKFGAADITDEMQAKALEAYKSDENSVSLSSPRENLPEAIVMRAKKAISDLLRYAPDWCVVNGRHGPGSVAEGTRNPAEKFAKWSCPVGESFEELPGFTHYLRVAHPKGTNLDGRDPYESKVCLVPKSWNKCRTICGEPALLQFGQQALGRELDLTLFFGKLAGIHMLDIHDQSRNQELALDGSRWYGDVATLDLSSASDLLSLDLVSLLWPPTWFSRFMQVRSKRTRCPNGDLLELAKFASMGNATTFPVQTITFWALAVATTLLLTGESANKVYREVCVYGDDIICRNAMASPVMGVLELAGLRVNQNKSYKSGSFRESCGIHAYDGHDCTPVYVRTDKYDPLGCTSICAAANGLYVRGFEKTAEFLFRRIEKALGARLPYSNVAGGLFRERFGLTANEVFDLNTSAGLQQRTNGVQSAYEAKSFLLVAAGRDYLEFQDTGDMWAFIGSRSADRDRGIRSKPGVKLRTAWRIVCRI